MTAGGKREGARGGKRGGKKGGGKEGEKEKERGKREREKRKEGATYSLQHLPLLIISVIVTLLCILFLCHICTIDRVVVDKGTELDI